MFYICDLSRAEEDIKETLVQDKEELTRAIETNLEDTTKAVVMLRKELNDGIGSEKEQRKSQETQLKANLESLQVMEASLLLLQLQIYQLCTYLVGCIVYITTPFLLPYPLFFKTPPNKHSIQTLTSYHFGQIHPNPYSVTG